MKGSLLFQLDDVPEGGTRGFAVREPGRQTRGLIAVRRGGVLRVYENQCPHRGTPLDWAPDEFLNSEGTHLICASHGALFQIADGVCVAGPCVGDQLEPFPVEVCPDGRVLGPVGVERA